MKLTAAQERVIAHRHPNLLVAASAGSGKTEVLARRCAALVADPQAPCDIDRLLVVTFTRAAAAELRVRVARMLRAAAEEARDPALRRHLRRQEPLVAGAEIGTIDAWCGRLVREFAAVTGVDAGFATLSEQDAALLRRTVLDELLTDLHRGTEPLAAEAAAWLARSTLPDDGFLRTLIGRLSAFREHLVNPDAWFAQQRAACAADDAAAVLAAALQAECAFQAAQLAGLLAAAEQPELAAALRPYAERLAGWCAALAAPGRLADVVADIGAFKLGRPRGRGAAEPALVEEVRRRWLGARLQEAWRADEIRAILGHAGATARLVALLLDLEERYRQRLWAAKQQTARYEFGDVLRLALDLLGTPGRGSRREPTPVARRLQERYAHVLVDEYQDTSPVQVEILRLVTRTAAGASNRFAVGDIKQSIYGFRQAEPRLFREQLEDCEAGRAEGRVEYLAENFRSHADLLDGLDRLFAQLLDRELGGTPYGPRERLRAARTEPAGGNPTLDGASRIELHLLEEARRGGGAAAEGDADDEVAVERIEREAQLAADRIRALLAAGAQVPERRGPDEIVLRPLRPADIVILLRSAQRNAGLAARVLRANGIRCTTGGRESLLDALEVQDVRNVLALLVNRRQDVPLAAYLRGPLAASPQHPDGALTPAELLRVRAAAAAGDDLCEAVERCRQRRPEAALAAKLDAVLARLDGWAAAARELELPALLRRIVQDSALEHFARGLPGGAQRAALLRALAALASEFARSREGGIAEFVAYLDALSAQELEPAALAAPDEDVVRIMTIHGAKGLEFPVVLLLATGSGFNRQRQSEALQCDEQTGLGLRFADATLRANLVSARHLVGRRRLAQRELEEELRLLYVAATRARELLVLVGHAAPRAWDSARARFPAGRAPPLVSRLSVQNHLEWILMAVAAGGLDAPRGPRPPFVAVTTGAADAIEVCPPGAAPPAVPAGTWTAADADWLARSERLLAAPVDRTLAEFPAVLSVSALKELALREPAADQPAVLGGQAALLREPVLAGGPARPEGTDIGTACHKFLERADLGRLGSAADVRAQLAELVAAGRLAASEAALVPVDDVAWLGGTEEGRLLAQHAAGARRELPLVYALPLGVPGEFTIVRGVLDCLLPAPEGLILLDYKTDRVRDAADLEARLAGYRVQMRLYAQAAAAVFARPVAGVRLVFLCARRVVPVAPQPLTPAELRPGAAAAEVDGGGGAGEGTGA